MSLPTNEKERTHAISLSAKPRCVDFTSHPVYITKGSARRPREDITSLALLNHQCLDQVVLELEATVNILFTIVMLTNYIYYVHIIMCALFVA